MDTAYSKSSPRGCANISNIDRGLYNRQRVGREFAALVQPLAEGRSWIEGLLAADSCTCWRFVLVSPAASVGRGSRKLAQPLISRKAASVTGRALRRAGDSRHRFPRRVRATARLPGGRRLLIPWEEHQPR